MNKAVSFRMRASMAGARNRGVSNLNLKGTV